MKLFSEFESAYYDLVTYLINRGEDFSSQELSRLLLEYVGHDWDEAVVDNIWSKNKDGELFFSYDEVDRKFSNTVDSIPIRLTINELNAVCNMADNPFAKHFLSEETLAKIRNNFADVVKEWDEKAYLYRRRFNEGILNQGKNQSRNISVILQAIDSNCAIKYDYTTNLGEVMQACEAFPVRIRYSLLSDLFYILAYDKQKGFVTFRLDMTDNITLLDIKADGLEQKFDEYIETNKRKVILNISPQNNAVERCFRIFSCYNRIARFDNDNQIYNLEIEYLAEDEGEIKRNILSLGSAVMVLEPENLRNEIIDSIKRAYERY